MTQVSSQIDCEQDDRQTTVHDLARVAVKTDLEREDVASLATLAQGGCAVAFARLAEWYWPRLIRFLEQRFPAARSDAEDVAQDTFTKAWANIASFQPEKNFATWLYTIAQRTAIDQARARKRQPVDSLDLDAKQATHEEQAALACAPTAERLLEVREQADNVWEVARGILSEPQFAALWLRYGEGLSLPEVAEVMRKTKVSVRVTLFRAKSKVRQAIEKNATRSGGHATGNSLQVRGGQVE